MLICKKLLPCYLFIIGCGGIGENEISLTKYTNVAIDQATRILFSNSRGTQEIKALSLKTDYSTQRNQSLQADLEVLCCECCDCDGKGNCTCTGCKPCPP